MYVQSLKIKTSCCVGWLVGVSSTSCCCSRPCSALRAESENSGLWTGQEREKGSEQLHSIGAEKLESLSGLPQQNIITTYIKAICTLVFGYLQLFKPIDFYLLHLRLVWTEKKCWLHQENKIFENPIFLLRCFDLIKISNQYHRTNVNNICHKVRYFLI